MYIIDKENIEIRFANSFIDKFMGFMFKKDFKYALRFKCNGIHTFFMKENIDVVLTDKNNKILYTYFDVKKNKIILPKKDVYYTYEFLSGNVKQLKVGDKIKIKSNVK